VIRAAPRSPYEEASWIEGTSGLPSLVGSASRPAVHRYSDRSSKRKQPRSTSRPPVGTRLTHVDSFNGNLALPLV